MKAKLFPCDKGWEFRIEAEDELEKCALQWLGFRPKNNFGCVSIEFFGYVFVPEEKHES